MIIDLAKLDRQKIKLDLEIEPNKLSFDFDYIELLDSIKFTGVFKSKPFWSLIEGLISGKLKVSCGRCLNSISYDMNFSFENAYIKAKNLTEEREAELSIEKVGVSIIDDNNLDLHQIVSEEISVELNNSIYCKKDCKGLCPKCGTNLNERDCKCDQKTIDSRWSGLKDIKIK